MTLTQWLERQREWSLRTFGPGRRTLGLVKHIRSELAEIEADPTDPMEWVDVMILALDGAWRTGKELNKIANVTLTRSTQIYTIHYFLDYLESESSSELPWIGVCLVAANELRNMGYTWPEIMATLEAKQIINFRRQWPAFVPEDEASEHIR